MEEDVGLSDIFDKVNKELERCVTAVKTSSSSPHQRGLSTYKSDWLEVFAFKGGSGKIRIPSLTGKVALEFSIVNRRPQLKESSKTIFVGEYFPQTFSHIKAPPGSGRFTIMAASIKFEKDMVQEKAKLKANFLDTLITLDEEKKEEKLTASRILSHSVSGRHVIVANTSHAICRLYTACQNPVAKIDMRDIIIIKCSKDKYESHFEEYCIDPIEALQQSEKGTLPQVVLATMQTFDTFDKELVSKIDPWMLKVLESSSIPYKSLLEVLLKIDAKGLHRICLVGDRHQTLLSEVSADKLLQSAFQSAESSQFSKQLEVACGINVPTAGIISKRLYGSKYKPTPEKLAAYKVERRPFCLIVDCLDGYEKKKKGDIVASKGHIRGSPLISDIFTAANCAKIYLDYDIPTTILTFYDKARLAIMARCIEMGLPSSFCNESHITTVDEYQSGKNMFVILVMDRDDLGVRDLCRQNVAVTRCRQHLTFICNSKTMQQEAYKGTILHDFYRHQDSHYIPASKLNESDAEDVIELLRPSASEDDKEIKKS